MASSRKTIARLQAAGPRGGSVELSALSRRALRSLEPGDAQFYPATSGLLFGLLLHSLHDTNIAEEVLSQVYADIRQEADQFDHRHNSLLLWLIAIAHWRAQEHSRASAASGTILNGPREHGLSLSRRRVMSRSADRRLVAARLRSLSPTQLQIIELAYFYRMSPLEIALRLGQRLEVVKAGLHDGVAKLCSLFKRDCPIS